MNFVLCDIVANVKYRAGDEKQMEKMRKLQFGPSVSKILIGCHLPATISINGENCIYIVFVHVARCFPTQNNTVSCLSELAWYIWCSCRMHIYILELLLRMYVGSLGGRS